MHVDNYTLRAPITARELAQHYRVSTMTITRWVRRGCPVLRTRPLLFDLDAVQGWAGVPAKPAI